LTVGTGEVMTGSITHSDRSNTMKYFFVYGDDLRLNVSKKGDKVNAGSKSETKKRIMRRDKRRSNNLLNKLFQD
jgi:hypothetical protein